MNTLDKQYTDLLQDILDNGVTKQDRTGTGTISVFGRQIRHNMKDGFPLLTTKKMPWKTIVTELLWFLRGDTNIKWLVDNGCNIWNGDAYKNYKKLGGKLETQKEFIDKLKGCDEFANKWGELGPIYGKQWRKWSVLPDKYGAYNRNPIDQIQNLINDLKTNPDSRRLMVNAWNVGELDQMVLPPCHYGFQVYTRELSLEERFLYGVDVLGYLGMLDFGDHQTNDLLEFMDMYKIPTRAISLMWNQRSVDTFLGLPFNIASYGLLLEIIAKEVNMIPEELIGNLGDVHLYSNHLDAAKEQIGRELTLDERAILHPTSEMFYDIHGSFSIGDSIESSFIPDDIRELITKEFDNSNIPSRTREPFPLPTLKFNPCPITGIDMEYQSIAQFQIENYQSHPAIKAPLSN